jgi:choline dehydrogenase-like flavoprotein
VRHRCTERDRRSLLALHEALAADFARAGVGQLDTDLASANPWPIDQDASHHMGTTRMGTDSATSVTDPNGRVHSVENVYMAGASLFPTSGCANPTFTIVALSIRLARHLRENVFREGAARAAGSRGTT